MPNHKLFKNVCFKDPFGTSVNHDDTNKRYRTNMHDSIWK
jgi:hypothetical protein